MAVVINGTTGITSVNGSAAAPSVTGTDTDTGVVYGTNTLSIATGGTTAVTVDSNQNVGIGTDSPTSFGTGTTVLQTNAASSYSANLVTSGAYTLQMITSSANGAANIGTRSNHSLGLCTNDIVRATINTSGYVTKPYQPAFRAARTTSFNSGSSGYPICSYDSYSGLASAFNTASCFNGSRFTAPVAGVYLFHSHFLADTTNALDWGFLINGGENGNTAMVFNATTNKSGNLFAVFNLAANDYVQVNARGYGVSAVASSLHNYFQGYLLG